MAHVPSIFKAELKQDFGSFEPETQRQRDMPYTRNAADASSPSLLLPSPVLNDPLTS